MFLGSCKEIGRDYSEREGEKVTRGMRTRDKDRERERRLEDERQGLQVKG